jgi:GNAT superfamily N-acetyltransferase
MSSTLAMPDQKIIKRKLSRPEAEDFATQITKTPNIVGYLPEELQAFKTVLVIEKNNEARGLLVYIEAQKFIDLKILLVKEEYRGKGLGSKLFTEFIKMFDKTDKPIYTVTRSEAVIAMLKPSDFQAIGLLSLPLPCILHQSKMVFSLYRTKEYLRKLIKYRRQDKFTYYIKLPEQP